MPDIAKCANNTCPMRLRCYRYRCIPDALYQSYGDFKPIEGHCENFWDAKGRTNLLPEDFVPINLFKDGEGI